MTQPSQGKTSRAHRAASQARQREVERCLAEHGLAGGPRGLAGEGMPPHFDGSSGRRLRSALERLGPVFAAFGRYLGSRPDLLPVVDCLELRQTEEVLPPLPPGTVHALIEGGAGRPFAELFAAVETDPWRSGLVTQTHRARLRDGWDVLVRLVRSDLGELLDRDLPHLPRLAAALSRDDRAPRIEPAIADFQQALLARADLQAEAAALSALRGEATRLGSLRLPRTALSSPRLLCLERLEGRSLGGLQPSLAPPAELADLARRLCLAWLYHALRGKAFPVEIDPRDVVVLADGSIGLQGSTFAGLTMTGQLNLRGYLEGAAAEDPDEACSFLLREMEPGPEGAETELRQRFRQSVAFRDGGWGSAQDGQSLAEQLCVQWRLTAELGFRPRPGLLSFRRGLFDLAVAVRPLSPPDRDPLRDALENLRLLSAVDQIGRMADLGRLQRGAAAYGAALADLPMALDAALTQLSEGRPRVRIEVAGGGAGRARRRGGTARTVSLGLALAAVALVTVRLGAAPGSGPWLEAIGTTLFLILGGLLLWSFGSGEARR